MEEIQKWTRRLLVEYCMFWLIALLLVAAFECGWLEEGGLVGQDRWEFALETASILLTLALIPGALRLFSRKVLTWRALPLLEALKAYHRWNLIRLIMLAVIAWGNLVLYYLTLNNIGGLCALLACLAALFCVPGKWKLMNELEITE